MPIIEYGEQETSYLAKRDKKLGALIASCGFVERELDPDVFGFLVRSIITQQISNKAALTVVGRMREKFPHMEAASIAAATDAEIQSIGISMRKVSYIRGLCEAVLHGSLVIDELNKMSDQEVAQKLLPIKGIGQWTVEMTLIFSLGRGDVVSFGDYAIRKGMMTLYGLKELNRVAFERYRKRYSSYGTVASIYLWEAAVL